MREGIDRRLTDSLETALKLADGVAELEVVRREGEAAADDDLLTFSEHLVCPVDGRSFEEPAPRNFSFNSPYGACPTCDGLGTTFEIDPELVIPDPDLSLNDGAIAPWRSAHTQYFTADARLRRRRCRHRHERAVGLAERQAAEGHPPGHGRQRHRQVQEPLRPPAAVHDDVRGRDPVDQAPPRGRRERLGARAVRGLHAPRAVQGLRRRPPQARDARRDDQRAQHLRGLRPVDRRGRQVPRRPRAHRARADDRRARDEGGQRPPRFPARRRPRLPDAVAVGWHAGRGRGPAHPSGQPDRLRPRRHAVRARRAVDRPAPARQPAPHRHPHPPARPRQHRHRRRARRGDDPGERLDRRHRARRRRARRRGGLQRPGEGRPQGQGLDHRAVPVGAQEDPRAGGAAPARRRAARGPGRPRAQPQRPRRDDPARQLRRHHGRVGIRQVDAGPRHPAAGPDAAHLQVEDARWQAPPDHRHRAARQGHRHGPVADRPHAALEPGHVHRRVRLGPQAVRLDERGQGARLHARALQLQRQGRTLRGLRRRRHDQDRDALPARRLRAVRGVQGRPLQPGHVGHRVQGQEHRRRARHAGRRGRRVLRQPALDQPVHGHPDGRRPRVRPPRSAGADPVGRRGPARQAGHRAGEAFDGPHDLPPRRADDRPPLRRRPPPAHGALAARRPGQHGPRHRAQPRRHQDRRLDHRPRARGRQRRRHDRRRRHPRARRHGGRQPHRPLPAGRCSAREDRPRPS